VETGIKLGMTIKETPAMQSGLAKYFPGGLLGLLLSAGLVVCCAGCASLSKQNDRANAPSNTASAAKHSPLAGNPRGAPASSKQSDEKIIAQKTAVKESSKPAKTSSNHPAAQAAVYDQVRDAAIKLAKSMKSIQGMKICHAREEDEWWVTIFDDLGGVLDIKQYTWNPESESFTPFLVMKRIPRSKLDAHLSTEDPGRSCRVIAPAAYRAD
jgi:hypothetical protein